MRLMAPTKVPRKSRIMYRSILRIGKRGREKKWDPFFFFFLGLFSSVTWTSIWLSFIKSLLTTMGKNTDFIAMSLNSPRYFCQRRLLHKGESLCCFRDSALVTYGGMLPSDLPLSALRFILSTKSRQSCEQDCETVAKVNSLQRKRVLCYKVPFFCIYLV